MEWICFFAFSFRKAGDFLIFFWGIIVGLGYEHCTSLFLFLAPSDMMVLMIMMIMGMVVPFGDVTIAITKSPVSF